MDASRFDILVRSLTSGSSRRGVLRRLVVATLGHGLAGRLPELTSAKKRKRKVKRNDFGCVNVGRFCKHGSQCCSGMCKGKKGKQKCRAHDTGGCPAGHHGSACGGANVPCTTSVGKSGNCETTTGNAGYCRGELVCRFCTKDAECVPFCGSGAACIRCEPFCSGFDGSACVGTGANLCI